MVRGSVIRTSKGHDKNKRQIAGPFALRWRGTFVCVGLALFVVLLSVPFFKTVVSQVRLIAPLPLDASVYRSVSEQFRSIPQIVVPWKTFIDLNNKNAGEASLQRDLVTWNRIDPGNTLAAYVLLLDRLRRRDGAAPASSMDAEIETLLEEIRTHGVLALPVDRERELTQQVFLLAGVSPRRAVVEADRIGQAYMGTRSYARSTFRELANRLWDYAEVCRTSGRPETAEVARLTLAHLMLDMAEKSAASELVLLAAEKLPGVLRELGGASEAEKVEAFQHRWHTAVGDDQVNVLPWMGDLAIVPDAQDRVLRSMCASIMALSILLVFGAFVLGMLPLVAFTRTAGDIAVSWRGGGWGQWGAALMCCLPMLAGWVFLMVGDLHFAWLLSFPSLQGVLVLPVLSVAVVGLATRLCACLGKRFDKASIPAIGVWGFVVLIVLVVLASCVFLPVHQEAWRPPVGVQLFRKVGHVAGVVCLVLIVTWLIWGRLRRRGAGLPTGVGARVTLAVTARALLLTAIICLGGLVVNQRWDRQHEAAFLKASDDPISAYVGPNWRSTYFGPVRSFLESRS